MYHNMYLNSIETSYLLYESEITELSNNIDVNDKVKNDQQVG